MITVCITNFNHRLSIRFTNPIGADELELITLLQSEYNFKFVTKGRLLKTCALAIPAVETLLAWEICSIRRYFCGFCFDIGNQFIDPTEHTWEEIYQLLLRCTEGFLTSQKRQSLPIELQNHMQLYFMNVSNLQASQVVLSSALEGAL